MLLYNASGANEAVLSSPLQGGGVDSSLVPTEVTPGIAEIRNLWVKATFWTVLLLKGLSPSSIPLLSYKRSHTALIDMPAALSHPAIKGESRFLSGLGWGFPEGSDEKPWVQAGRKEGFEVELSEPVQSSTWLRRIL